MKESHLFYIIASLLAAACISSAHADSYCDNTCSPLIQNGQATNLAGNGTWSSSDAAWCAVNGYPISSSSPTPTASSSPVPVISMSSTPAMIALCQAHQNSQLVAYCLAYETAEGAQGPEKMLAGLDVAAAGTCAVACAAKITSPPLEKACEMVGMADSVAEFVSTFAMKTEGAGAKINALFAAGGAVTALGAGNAAAALAGNTQGFNALQTSLTQAQGELTSATSTLNSAKDSASIAASNLGSPAQVLSGNVSSTALSNSETAQAGVGAAQENVSTAQTEVANAQANINNAKAAAQKKAKNEACMSTAFFTIMSAVRISNISKEDQLKGNACNNVHSLAGTEATAAGGSYGPMNAINANGTGSGSGVASGSDVAAGTQLSCIQTASITACSTGGTQMSAAEAGPLDTSGLSQPLAPQAADLLSSLGSSGGGSGGGGTGGASSGIPGDMKTAMAQLSAIAEHANGDVVGGISSSGGGGGGSAKAGSDSPFPNIFGALAGASGDGNPNRELGFKTGSDDSDIFHSKSKLSLFQIVSNKLTQVNDRLNRLDWASPMNRALAGNKR
jgi:hypothetical protein